VDIESAYLARSQSDYYLAAGRLVDYKRFDLAIEACKRLDRPLRIVGDGPQLARLRKLAGKNSPIDFLGTLSDAGLWEQYAHCRALLFPGEEDFGIVPVEAQACGRPVIAYARGGALETVIGIDPRENDPPRSPTGIFYHEQTAESLARAILTYEGRENEFRPGAIRRNAARFSAANFERQIRGFIDEKRNHLKPDQPATAKGLRHSVMLGK
jgi:glycosyltransferase involved in cell wall biosynthesis